MTKRALWKPIGSSEDWFGLVNSLEDIPSIPPSLDRLVVSPRTSTSTPSLDDFMTKLYQKMADQAHDHEAELSVCKAALREFYEFQDFPPGYEIEFDTWIIYMDFLLADNFSSKGLESVAAMLLESNLQLASHEK